MGRSFILKDTTYNPVTFPIQFPNTCLSVSLTRAYSNINADKANSLAADSIGPANMNVINPGADTIIYYIAIGH